MTNVNFIDQKNGYDKEQVDSYITKITEAYKLVYDEHQAISDKYNALLQDHRKSDAEKQTLSGKYDSLEREYNKLADEKQAGSNAGVIAKALLDAETLAKKIIDSAYIEAARVAEQEKVNIETAHAKVKQALAEATELLTSH